MNVFAWCWPTCRVSWVWSCARLLDEGGITLDRFALLSVDSCPNLPARLVFDSDIQLTTPEISIRTVCCAWTPTSAATTCPWRITLLPCTSSTPRSGERVAQGDTGIGPGFIVPFRSEIDISALPPGDYEVRVAL